MADNSDLRRRKPDDDSTSALKPERCGDGISGSDDEHQSHHKKPGLTTADSSDHVNISIYL